MGKSKIIVMTILLVLIFLYLFIALFFYLKQESILFHPVKTAENFVYKFPHKFEEIYFNTPNDGKNHALRFKVANPKGIVYYLHGNAGNLEDWAWIYQQNVARNYDVLIIDYRTYGKSTGVLSELNMHSDVQYIYNELKKEFPEEKIIIHGRSIGTGMAAMLCAENNPKALILESPYFNIADIAKRMVPFLPVNLILKYKFESNKYLQKVSSPIYILHGTNDNVIPFDSGKKLYQSIEDKATFYSFENGTHSNLSTFDSYQTFLDEILD